MKRVEVKLSDIENVSINNLYPKKLHALENLARKQGYTTIKVVCI